MPASADRNRTRRLRLMPSLPAESAFSRRSTHPVLMLSFHWGTLQVGISWEPKREFWKRALDRDAERTALTLTWYPQFTRLTVCVMVMRLPTSSSTLGSSLLFPRTGLRLNGE